MTASKKPKKLKDLTKEQLLAQIASMKIVPFQSWQSGNDKLLKMTGDERSYGGGPTRTTRNYGNLKNK